MDIVVCDISDFWQFLLWVHVVVLKEGIFNSFYFREGVVVLRRSDFLTVSIFGRMWCSWKKSFITVSTFSGCGGLGITDFWQFPLLEGVVVLKEDIFNSFHIWRLWWSLKEVIFNSFYYLVSDAVVLKQEICNSFYFGRLWWSWKKSFLTVSTLGGCGGLGITDF